MIAAVIVLALIVAGLGGVNVWLLREARNEGRLTNAAGREVLDARERELELSTELVAARVDVARLTTEHRNALAEVDALRDLVAAAREVIADARKHAVLDAPPDQRGALIDELLRQRVAEVTARRLATGHRDAPADAVPGPGAATDGPRPAWVDA